MSRKAKPCAAGSNATNNATAAFNDDDIRTRLEGARGAETIDQPPPIHKGERLAMRNLILMSVLGVALAQSSTTCPIDDSSAYFTGRTKTDASTGRLLREYKCNRAGHVFWMRAS